MATLISEMESKSSPRIVDKKVVALKPCPLFPKCQHSPPIGTAVIRLILALAALMFADQLIASCAYSIPVMLEIRIERCEQERTFAAPENHLSDGETEIAPVTGTVVSGALLSQRKVLEVPSPHLPVEERYQRHFPDEISVFLYDHLDCGSVDIGSSRHFVTKAFCCDMGRSFGMCQVPHDLPIVVGKGLDRWYDYTPTVIDARRAGQEQDHCSEPVQGGRGDPLFCIASDDVVINYVGVQLTVPKGWLYGWNAEKLQIQRRPLKEMGSFVLGVPTQELTQRFEQLEQAGYTCESAHDGLTRCEVIRNGIIDATIFIPVFDHVSEASFGYPLRVREYFEKPFDMILDSITSPRRN